MCSNIQTPYWPTVSSKHSPRIKANSFGRMPFVNYFLQLQDLQYVAVFYIILKENLIYVVDLTLRDYKFS